jgi:threonine dehydrogenase-like Zn-dependent dehydrogenase
MATTDSSAPAHPSTEEETPHGCYGGVVYIGHLVVGYDGGDEVEVIEAVPCRRCADSR